jgi:hypothetical protein
MRYLAGRFGMPQSRCRKFRAAKHPSDQVNGAKVEAPGVTSKRPPFRRSTKRPNARGSRSAPGGRIDRSNHRQPPNESQTKEPPMTDVPTSPRPHAGTSGTR